jgi:hypothetical protein
MYACVVAFATFMCMHYYVDVVAFPYDSLHYWTLSGPDSLLSYPKTIRGYVYPLMLSPIRVLERLTLDSHLATFRVVSSLAYAYLLTIAVPDFFVSIFGGTVSLYRRLSFPLLLAIVFPGLLLFPLSDLPAFLLLIAGVSFAVRAESLGTFRPLFWSGMLVSASYNVRTIYLFSFLLLAVAIPVALMAAKTLTGRFISLLVFVLGALLVAAPQLLINIKNYGIASPLVQANDMRGDQSLLAAQLRWGLIIQRYETSMRPDSPAPSLFYLDTAGANIYNSEHVEKTPTTVVSYIKLVFKNPVEFMGVYGRHFVNGLDVRDGMVYVKTESPKRNLFSVFNFCILFVSFLLFVAPRPGIFSTSTLFMAATLLAPVIAIVPGAVETRFFLPLHVIAYGTIAFRFDWGAVRKVVIARPLLLTLSFVISLMTFTAIATSTMTSPAYSWPLQYR